MITGHLQEKSGRYYMVLNLYIDGKWKPKWITTKLPVKGNKKKAEAMLRETISKYEAMEAEEKGKTGDDILFSDYMLKWLELMRSSVEDTTFTSYRYIVKDGVAPFFAEKGVTLLDLRPKDIQEYYEYLMVERNNSAVTVRRHHANIRKALQHAVKADIILSNPADKVEKPKPKPYRASFYNADDLNVLFSTAKGTRLELPILIAAHYGLRRSEVLGLKWDAVNFTQNTISICHIVSEAKDDQGNSYLVQKDRAKNKSSLRTLPLMQQIRDALLQAKDSQKMYAKVCGREYCKEYKEYIFVDELGHILNPGYLTQAFPNFLEKHGLKRIRFHDLRHSCASLLLANGVSMKAIQEWLGHSNFATTANLYAHLEYESKLEAARAISSKLTHVLGPDTGTPEKKVQRKQKERPLKEKGDTIKEKEPLEIPTQLL